MTLCLNSATHTHTRTHTYALLLATDLALACSTARSLWPRHTKAREGHPESTIDRVAVTIHAVECEGQVDSTVHDAHRPGRRRDASVYSLYEVLHIRLVGGRKVSYYSAYPGVSLGNYLYCIH